MLVLINILPYILKSKISYTSLIWRLIFDLNPFLMISKSSKQTWWWFLSLEWIRGLELLYCFNTVLYHKLEGSAFCLASVVGFALWVRTFWTVDDVVLVFFFRLVFDCEFEPIFFFSVDSHGRSLINRNLLLESGEILKWKWHKRQKMAC